MEKNDYFFKDSVWGFISLLLLFMTDILLMIVFYNFRQYAAMAFLGVGIPIILLASFSFIVITKDGIKLFSFGKYKAVIPLDELQTIDTHAGHPDTMTFYGAGDMITCRYNGRVIEKILSREGIAQEIIEEFMNEGENGSVNNGKWSLERENVLLDRLFGKKKYIHRRVTCYEKSDIFG